MISSRACLLRGAILAAAMPMTVGSGALAQELPRYKLQVGQELIYRQVQPPDDAAASTVSKVRRTTSREFVFHVVDQDVDGRWKIVFQDRQKNSIERPGRPTTEETRVSEKYCDLAADGRVKMLGVEDEAGQLPMFPSLPHDRESLSSSWGDADRKTRALSPYSPSAGPWRFVQETRGRLHAIEFSSARHEYKFDPQQGLVIRLTATVDQEWPEKRAGSRAAEMEFASTRQLAPEDLRSFRDEAARYFAVCTENRTAFERLQYDVGNTARILDEIESRWRELDERLKHPLLRPMVADKLNQWERQRPAFTAEADRALKLLDQPAPDWQTTDLDGKPYSLADLRGKVVVLDFWYAACPPCLLAMPQLKQLAVDFADQRVVLLGINSDAVPADARFVIDKMQLNYPTLNGGPRVEGINKQYDVTSFPTLVIIDPQGIIRQLRRGYSPALRSEVAEKVRALLPK